MAKTEKPKIPTPPLQTSNTLAGLIFIYKMAMRIFVQAFAHLSTLALPLISGVRCTNRNETIYLSCPEAKYF